MVDMSDKKFLILAGFGKYIVRVQSLRLQLFTKGEGRGHAAALALSILYNMEELAFNEC